MLTNARKHFNSFAVIDLETNTIPQSGRRVQITELSISAVSKDNFLTSSLKPNHIPRILNRLNLVFRPQGYIDPVVENMTGLNNYLLENETSFNEKTCDIINLFLEHLRQPVCLIAHNGDNFDFEILKEHFRRKNKSFLSGLLTVDSLKAFKFIDCFRQISIPVNCYKLRDVCWRVLNEKPVHFHQASGDVESLLKCMLHYGKHFLDYCEQHAEDI